MRDYAYTAGFRAGDLVNAIAAAWAESDFIVDAHNPVGEDSRGLWQINISGNQRLEVDSAPVDPERLLDDPAYNARAAFAVSGNGADWCPWCTLGNVDYVDALEGTGDYATHFAENARTVAVGRDETVIRGAGDRVRVVAPINVRSIPAGTLILDDMEVGDGGTVIGDWVGAALGPCGPQCGEPRLPHYFIWWQIEWDDGLIGWSVEDFLARTTIGPLQQYTLTLMPNPSGGGSITANPPPTNGTYAGSTVVQLMANPDSGYQFSSWTGDAAGTSNPTTITITGNRSVTANFTVAPPQRYSLTLAPNPSNGGLITANPLPTNGTYALGTVVQLTANPAAGYQFSSWTGDASGTSNSTTITITGNRSVTANFTALPEPSTRGWLRVATGEPPSRLLHQSATDYIRGRVVLFGGVPASQDVWEFNGSSWYSITPAECTYTGMCPGPRNHFALSFDGNSVLLFGGGWTEIRNDTWAWNGQDWVERTPSNAPSARNQHAMAYDEARRVIVLFGGADAQNNYLGDTWEWSGGNWVFRTNGGPAPRVGHALAYDASRGATVLFGGDVRPANDGQVYGDTWEWDGTTWSLRSTTGPSPRIYHAMAYHETLEVVVLHGGQGPGADNYHEDTWEWDGNAWTQVSAPNNPGRRAYHSMSYDPQGEQIILFGGVGNQNSDTWGYGGSE